MGKISKNNYVIILCGGTGPRLWPQSRADHPKQFLKFFSGKSLLANTIDRVIDSIDPSHIFIVSNQRYQKQLQEETKGLLEPQQIIVEPEKKNTAMAILYAAAIIQKINPKAVIASLPSDHFIAPVGEFTQTLNQAFELAANSNHLITLGIKPSHPSPSYGYILPQSGGVPSPIKCFVEKPDESAAQDLIKQGAYWNSGLYIFKAESLISELRQHSPEYMPVYEEISQHLNDTSVINSAYASAPNLAIDKAVSEKSANMLVIPASFQWSDIGEWRSIHSLLPHDNNQNAVLNNTKFLSVESSGNLISTSNSSKLIGLVGVNNLAIIDTPDALLVCDLSSSYYIRELVAKITENPATENYFLLSPSSTKNDQKK